MEENEKERMARLARQVRDACVHAARQGFEEAGMAGLCAEGALENAIEAIRMVDLESIIQPTAG